MTHSGRSALHACAKARSAPHLPAGQEHGADLPLEIAPDRSRLLRRLSGPSGSQTNDASFAVGPATPFTLLVSGVGGARKMTFSTSDLWDFDGAGPITNTPAGTVTSANDLRAKLEGGVRFTRSE